MCDCPQYLLHLNCPSGIGNKRRCGDVPLGAEKWMTLPSLLNMLTSSMAWIGWTLSFFSAVWSFLSSVPAPLWTFLTFLRGVPLPLLIQLASCTSCSPFFPP